MIRDEVPSVVKSSSGSSLAAWLHGLDRSQLETVLALRRDVAAPPLPRSAGELADRLQRPGSVALMLPHLMLPCLQVAETLAAYRAPTTRESLADMLGVADKEAELGLDEALLVLTACALVWPDDDGMLHLAEPLQDFWDSPLELDPPLAVLLANTTSYELRGMLVALGLKPLSTREQRLAALQEHHLDPERIAEVVARAPTATRELLERRALQAPRKDLFIMFGGVEQRIEPGARWALDRGLLVQWQHGYGPARMPAEVALLLRGPDWYARFTPAPPAVPLAPVTPQEVDREAAATATAFAAQAAAVLSACAAAPPARLKSGAVGARELGRIGKAAQCEDAVLRITLETARAAGLLTPEGDHVVATKAYDAWAEQEPGRQLTVLLQAWLNLPFTPSRTCDEDGKVLPVLAGAPPQDDCIHARLGLLDAAAQLPAGQGVLSAPELGTLAAWYRPLAEQSPVDETPFATTVREAELLGVLARGALSPSAPRC